MSLAESGPRRAPGTGAFRDCEPGLPSFSPEGRCGWSQVSIDTGARRTVMNPAMAARHGLTDRSRAVGDEPLVGAAGGEVPTWRYTQPVTVAGVQLDSGLVAELPKRGKCGGACARMILSMDELGTLSSLKITRSAIELRP